MHASNLNYNVNRKKFDFLWRNTTENKFNYIWKKIQLLISFKMHIYIYISF